MNWGEGIFEGLYSLDSVDITVKNTGDTGWRLYRCGVDIDPGGSTIEFLDQGYSYMPDYQEYIYINPGETRKIHVDTGGTFYRIEPGRYTVKITLSHTRGYSRGNIGWLGIAPEDVAATYECSVNAGGVSVPGFSFALCIAAIMAALAGVQLWKRRWKRK